MELIYSNGRRGLPCALRLLLPLLLLTAAHTLFADAVIPPSEEYCALSTHYLEQRVEDVRKSVAIDYSCLTHLAALSNPKTSHPGVQQKKGALVRKLLG
jgi:hypothetical protein